MKKLLFIVNPKAGRTRSLAPMFNVMARFSEAGYIIKLVVTEKSGDARRAAAQLGEQFDLVVCAGGDGTLNETLNGLMKLENKPPVGYIPHGSTNDFATSLEIPDDPVVAAAAISCGRTRPLDLGRHNQRHFAYVASFGAFTRASYSATQAAKNALGHLAYIFEGLNSLDTLRPYRCRIEADGEVFEGEFIFGGICNSTSLGGLVKLDPKLVKMDDGKFELLLLRMPKTPADLTNLSASLTKMEYNEPNVIFRHVEHVVVTTEDDLPWSLDGEKAASEPRVEIDCIHPAFEIAY